MTDFGRSSPLSSPALISHPRPPPTSQSHPGTLCLIVLLAVSCFSAHRICTTATYYLLYKTSSPLQSFHSATHSHADGRWMPSSRVFFVRHMPLFRSLRPTPSSHLLLYMNPNLTLYSHYSPAFISVDVMRSFSLMNLLVSLHVSSFLLVSQSLPSIYCRPP